MTAPFAVDAASGTERAPGHKDPAKVEGLLPRRSAPPEPQPRHRMSTPPQDIRPPGREREFGPYGGRFVPETLMPALDELEAAG